jgi:hypothetical protein
VVQPSQHNLVHKLSTNQFLCFISPFFSHTIHFFMSRSLPRIQNIIPRMSTLSPKPQTIPGASSHAPTGTAHDSHPNPLSDPLKIRNSPDTVPNLVYGTAWKEQRTLDLVYQAIKSGFRGIDTAAQPRHYREDLVGAGIRRAIKEGLVQREDLFVSSGWQSVSAICSAKDNMRFS